MVYAFRVGFGRNILTNAFWTLLEGKRRMQLTETAGMLARRQKVLSYHVQSCSTFVTFFGPIEMLWIHLSIMGKVVL